MHLEDNEDTVALLHFEESNLTNLVPLNLTLLFL